MTRELKELSSELRGMLNEANATLVLATAPLSHAARVNATPLRAQHAVPVPERLLETDLDLIDSMDARIGVMACAELSDSSVECAAHVRENGRCTLLVSSSGRAVRFFARDARIVEANEAIFARLVALLPSGADGEGVRNFVLLPVVSIVETALGVALTALDRSIDGLPGLRSAAVARVYDDDDSGGGDRAKAAKQRADLTSVQRVPPLDDDDESKDGLNHTYPGFALADDNDAAGGAAGDAKPRSRRPSSLVQLDVTAPPKADTFSFAATALLLGFIGGYAVALKMKHTAS